MQSSPAHTHTHTCTVLSASQLLWAVSFHAKCWPNVSISNLYQINFIISVVEKTCCYLLIFVLILTWHSVSHITITGLTKTLQSVIALRTKCDCSWTLPLRVVSMIFIPWSAHCWNVWLLSHLGFYCVAMFYHSVEWVAQAVCRLEKSMEQSTTVLCNYS